MSIIQHSDQPVAKGYNSKIINRMIVSSEVGAESHVIWDQTIPPGGYIVPHYHEFEETFTFLAGSSQVMVGVETYQVKTDTTTSSPSNIVCRASIIVASFH